MVPLSSVGLPPDDSVTLINQINQDQLQNVCLETLSELPCEVEIKEMNTDSILDDETTIYEPLKKKHMLSEMFDTNMQTKTDIVSIFDADEENAIFKTDYQTKKEEKRTSILEQVLTGNLTMNNHQKLQPRAKLTSEWWCAPCNSYYR